MGRALDASCPNLLGNHRKRNCGGLAAQDIPKTADHAPSRTFYTFRAVPEDAFRTLLLNLVQALLNVRLRLQHELLKEKEVPTSPLRSQLRRASMHP